VLADERITGQACGSESKSLTSFTVNPSGC
jgi:hypothetical protein